MFGRVSRFYATHSLAVKHFAIWLAWLLVGMIFYAEHDFAGNYCKGFYYAVNVGYSIGLSVLHLQGTREWKNGSYAFSTLYVLSGALAIVISLTKVVSWVEAAVRGNEKKWYTSLYAQHLLAPQRNWKKKIRRYVLARLDLFLRIIIWLLFVLFGWIWSCFMFDWSFWEGLYFAVSSLSTGGLLGIPADAPDLCFLFVGLYCCTGIPVMGMGVAAVATLIMEEAKKTSRGGVGGVGGGGAGDLDVNGVLATAAHGLGGEDLAGKGGAVAGTLGYAAASHGAGPEPSSGGHETRAGRSATQRSEASNSSSIVFSRKELALFDRLLSSPAPAPAPAGGRQSRAASMSTDDPNPILNSKLGSGSSQGLRANMNKQSYMLLHLIREGAVDAGELEAAMLAFESIYSRQQLQQQLQQQQQQQQLQQQQQKQGPGRAVSWDASLDDVEAAPGSPASISHPSSSPSQSPTPSPKQRRRSESGAVFFSLPSDQEMPGAGGEATFDRSIELELHN